MPKMAAMLLGLALVAFSIGFNTARYPIVWEMVGPVGQPAAVSEPASIAPPQPAQPENLALAETQQPSPVAELPQPSPVAEPPADSDPTAALAESRKPLVPVLPISVPKDAAGNAEPVAGIHRLPPVDHSGPGPGDRYTAQFFAGAVAVYPSTSNP